MELVTETLPDLVLLDLHLPNLDGFGVVEAIRHAAPKVRILGAFLALRWATRCSAWRNRACKALWTRTPIRSPFSNRPSRQWARESPIFPRRSCASRRRGIAIPVVRQAADRSRACSNPVADRRAAERPRDCRAPGNFPPETVEKHRFNLLGKLGLQTTTELARYAREHGFYAGCSSGRRWTHCFRKRADLPGGPGAAGRPKAARSIVASRTLEIDGGLLERSVADQLGMREQVMRHWPVARVKIPRLVGGGQPRLALGKRGKETFHLLIQTPFGAVRHVVEQRDINGRGRRTG